MRLSLSTLFSACALLVTLSFLHAQDEPKKETADAPAEAKEEPTEWSKVVARKKEIATTLQKLGKEFQTAKVERKEEIRSEYEKLIAEFQSEVFPKMVELAPTAFKADPSDVEAGEVLLREALSKNDYPKVVEVGEKLVEAGADSGAVLSHLGAGYYGEHQFEKAVEVLGKAEKNGTLDERFSRTYYQPSKEYISLWKKEQEIRAKEAAAEGNDKLPVVQFQTSKGKIVMELFENEAPNTVANFVSLIENGTYDGIKFHRVIPNFMIQGGDPLSKDDNPANDGTGGPGYTIKCECFEEDARMHFSGSLSMAHSGKDTGGSQFFITHHPTWHLNPNNGTQSNHTVFGRVTEGLDIVRSIEAGDVIEKAEVVFKRDHDYKPETTPDK